MSFKYIGKERRKPYTGAKSIDKTCRNHGTCEWCFGNRTFFDKKRRSVADYDLKQYLQSEHLDSDFFDEI